MIKHGNKAVWLMTSALLLSGAAQAFAADAPAATAQVKTAAQAAAELGVLQGDGNGVSQDYLAKSTTRMQAAILFLRLKGLEQTALTFKGTDSFSDANLVGASNQPVLAYLKANPQLGWGGTGSGKFDPLAQITSQQYYKVLLESLGYKQDTDFKYDDIITYAKSIGLSQISGAGQLRNSNIATATVEALRLKVKGGTGTLLDMLVEQKVVAKEKAAAIQGTELKAAYDAALGAYLADANGMALYYYTKDMPGMSMCYGQCAVNWPIYYADNLFVPGEMNAADFTTITRDDGKKQTAYKGMPLYYYIKDTAAGDVKGQDVGKVWYIINPIPAAPAASSNDSAASEAKEIQIDIANFAFSQPDITVPAGTQITFTNKDKVQHNAVSDMLDSDGKPVFSIPLLKQGESASIVLNTPGEFTYYCLPHKAMMKAKITVQ